MEAEDPLKDLADIHLPDPVSFWPPAPGWWVLAALVLAALIYAGLRYAAHWRRKQHLLAALRELDEVYATYQSHKTQTDHDTAGLTYLQECNTVLKRVALLHHSADSVARLHGKAWLAFLDSEGETQDFTQGEGRILGDGGYRPTFDGDVEAIQALCKQWIHHAYARAEARRMAKPRRRLRRGASRQRGQRMEA
jgi:hypothetical protein